MRKRVLMAIAATGYSKIVVAAMQLALVPALALSWGLPLYGHWLMLASIPMFLGASDFGFGGAAGVRIIGEVAREETDEALCTFQSALALVMVATSIMAVVAIALCWLVPADILEADGGMGADDARITLTLLCGYGLSTLSAAMFTAIARAHGRQAQSIFLMSTVQLLENLAILATALLGGGPVEAAASFLCVRLMGQVANVIYAHKVASWLRLGFGKADWARFVELRRPAVGLMLWPISQAIYLQGTIVATGAAGGAALVPIATAIRTLTRTGTQLMLAFCMPLMPDYTAAHARNNVRRMELIGGLLAIVNLAFGLVAAILLALLGPLILELWTDGAVEAPYVMFLLVAAGLPIGLLWNSLANLLIALNRQEAITYWFAIIAVITVGLTYLGVSRFGVEGAAMANLFLEVGVLGVVLLAIRRHAARLEISMESILAPIPRNFRDRLPFGLSQRL